MKTCLITGANRGIGFEIAKKLGERGHRVILSGRDIPALEHSVLQLTQMGITADLLHLDVTDPESIKSAANLLLSTNTTLDVLINNAGVFLDSIQKPSETSLDDIHKSLTVNLVGPWLITQAFLPLLSRSEEARLIFLSTDLAALSQAADPHSKYNRIEGPAYRASKAALNMLALQWAKEFRDSKISVSVCSPGWCRTDLDSQISSEQAPNSAAEGADTVVWLALDKGREQHGHFYSARQTIDW
ncbi:SDR family NAD(P)-dependent oxidoreductase [Xenorhabdus bovienii]|uniref:SDR family NAD(P)-dependent oxidoreductase n=2 Tax=Xenorhabdus bovienii TaxID=40576 RepID=A0AAJ1J8W1_XENBV|nr:SDR family NAD(P)-dependent oxidoreductase [Xenorhabdus bovienii]MDE1473104.1 SDR family NAD(P)-dependent oxidoreductase [Xenorhabdus bovienii]MDE1479325.1 SDR family NAD(P)-dependent oxidoreductase [Xenorhabdus bovienii]MDE1482018.1 SDR family NAD(P)-dependent oxidoreductase [Xenorhabdus bovienii]MDE1488413.1 SDR family NAD(P)-dependent oxidoreductase [Xenorhabdus bovienii]MDE1492227.1 SDR family NAD(P)-dependent oxidoreductase [Xenorhabdus bovienii]